MTDTKSSSPWWLLSVCLATALLWGPFFRIASALSDDGLLLHGAELMSQGK